jgi:hypothetical protein
LWHVWGNRRGLYRVLAARPDGRRFEDLGAGWENYIKSDIQEVGWGRMASIDLAQDRSDCLNAAVNLLVP